MFKFLRSVLQKKNVHAGALKIESKPSCNQVESLGSEPVKKTTTWQERAASVGALIQNGEQPSYDPIGLTTISPKQKRARQLKNPGPPPDKNATAEVRDAWTHQARMFRVQESEEASKHHGFRVLYMHLSALSPTTRKSHAERHGKLFTAEEVEAFWADPTNRVGCKCSVTAVLVDEEGKPLIDTGIRRVQTAYENMKKRGYNWSK